MKIEINVKKEVEPRVINAFCAQYNYPEMVQDNSGNDIPNPMSREEFVKRCLVNSIRNLVGAYEANLSMESAKKKALERAEKELDIS